MMYASRLPLHKWALAFYLFNMPLKGVSSMKLHRDLDIAQRTARYLQHRMRQACNDKTEAVAQRFAGPVEADRKQRGDKGIIGWGRLPIKKGKLIETVFRMKGGSAGPGDVQAFNGARQKANADSAIFTCLDKRVTADMKNAVASAGRFMNLPVVQLHTIEDYFAERRTAMPIAA